ncbi:torsin-1A [Agrilus planipennis]|uniref:Torsin-1A n=1 Tax=Agrilus planipennis TaxID=224129 RepID=A0A7F5RJ73_AGRPL|nr:torsin-1A [Agrilus planipennis]
MNVVYETVILILCCLSLVSCFDPFSIGTGAALAASYLYQNLKNTVCFFKECCTEREIPANFNRLETSLKEKLYGQNLVHDVVVNALKGHWNGEPTKALTLSFHGTPGCGKNYVTTFIVESLYAKGSESVHVHNFLGRIHFPLKDKTEEYQQKLYQWIKGNVTKCARQIFIFDEVDKIPPKVLNILKPLIDYNARIESVDYRKAVFIFLSNTGGSLIADQFLKLWQLGVRREDIHLKDFESLMTKGAFNEEGGFQHSDTIKSNLIDHFVPFLPLEQEHVIECIRDEYKKRGVQYPSQELIDEILVGVEWGPQPHNLFSKTGCKRLSQKVALAVQKHGLYKKNN